MNPKIILLAAAAFIGIPGLIYLFAPHFMVAANGMALPTVNDAHATRAAYGGGFVAFATLFALGALIPRLTAPALVGVITFMGGFAVGRIFSLIVDGRPIPLFMALTVGEIIFAFLAYRAWTALADRS